MPAEVVKLSEKIDEILGLVNERVAGIFVCPSCKTNKYTRYNMIQDRSGDEGRTAYVTCMQCRKQWKSRV